MWESPRPSWSQQEWNSWWEEAGWSSSEGKASQGWSLSSEWEKSPPPQSDWDEVRPVAIEWWERQEEIAKRFQCKGLKEDDKVMELWNNFTTDQVAWVVGGGDLLRERVKGGDKPGYSKMAAMFMLRVKQYREHFPHEPQDKGKGKRKGKEDKHYFKSKIMKTATGKRIQEHMDIQSGKGKEGKGGKDGKGVDPAKGKKGPVVVPPKGTEAQAAQTSLNSFEQCINIYIYIYIYIYIVLALI